MVAGKFWRAESTGGRVAEECSSTVLWCSLEADTRGGGTEVERVVVWFLEAAEGAFYRPRRRWPSWGQDAVAV